MKKIVIILSLLALLIPQFVFALIPEQKQIVPSCINSGGPVGACGLCDFFLLVKNIFDFVAFALVPAVGAFVFLIAGFLFLTSGGSEQRVTQAKKLFVGVVIGAAIVYVAWIGIGSLIYAIGKEGGVGDWTPTSWNSFTCGSQ